MCNVLCAETIKTMKKLKGELVCAHTCTEYLIKHTQIGNVEVWKGTSLFTFHMV